jgi:hypothetical protein
MKDAPQKAEAPSIGGASAFCGNNGRGGPCLLGIPSDPIPSATSSTNLEFRHNPPDIPTTMIAS